MRTQHLLLERRNALLAELYELGDLVAGSFFEREVRGTRRYCLSRMVNGKQRQIYVSAAHQSAVQEGVRHYQRALELLRKLGETNLALIKEGIDLDDI